MKPMMSASGPVLFSYFIYVDGGDIHIGYGTQAAGMKSLSRGERIGKRRFARREEAESARMKWRGKFHITGPGDTW